MHVSVAGVIDASALNNVRLGSEGSLALDHIGALGGPTLSGGSVQIKTKAGITDGRANGDYSANIFGSTVELEGGPTGGIGAGANAAQGIVARPVAIEFFLNGGVLTALADKDIYIYSQFDNVTVNELYSTLGAVNLIADGAILSGSPGNTVPSSNDWNISGASVHLQATNNIGTSYNPFVLDTTGPVWASAQGGVDLFEVADASTANPGNLKVDEIQAGGPVILGADGSIFDAHVPTTTDPFADVISNGNVTLDAGLLGNIGIADAPGVFGNGNVTQSTEFKVSAIGLLNVDRGKNAYIMSPTSDMTLGLIDVTGTINLEAPNGRIINGEPTGYNLISTTGDLYGSGNVGAPTNPIEAHVGHVQGESAHGGVWINNDGVPIKYPTGFTNLTTPLITTYGTSFVTFSGILSAANQIPTVGEIVVVTVNGVTVNAPIHADGSFSARIDTSTFAAQVPPYAVTYSYAGDASFAPVTDSSSTTLTINKAPGLLSLSGLARTYSGNPQPVTVTTTPGQLSGVLITYNGSSIPPTNAGTYQVIASLNNVDYAATSVTGKLVIARATPVFTAYLASSSVAFGTPTVTLAGTLAAGPITPPNGEKISITINGVTQTALLTSNGSFICQYNINALPISATPYKVTYSYAGDANFAAVINNSATIITVFSTTAPATPVVTVVGGSFVYDGASHGATGRVTGINGVSLGALTFTYSGKGYATTHVPPTHAGTYTVVGTFAGNGNYSARSTSATITIRQTASRMTVSPVTLIFGTRAALSAKLLSTSGAPLAGKMVTFTLHGVKIGTAITDSHGVATLGTSLTTIAPGVYPGGVSATFSGDGDVTAATGIAALTVADPPIIASALQFVVGKSGVENLARFTQARGSAVAADFTATINWGDGSAVAPGKVVANPTPLLGFLVQANHAYPAKPGRYTITVTVHSKFGSAAVVTSHVTI